MKKLSIFCNCQGFIRQSESQFWITYRILVLSDEIAFYHLKSIPTPDSPEFLKKNFYIICKSGDMFMPFLYKSESNITNSKRNDKHVTPSLVNPFWSDIVVLIWTAFKRLDHELFSHCQSFRNFLLRLIEYCWDNTSALNWDMLVYVTTYIPVHMNTQSDCWKLLNITKLTSK